MLLRIERRQPQRLPLVQVRQGLGDVVGCLVLVSHGPVGAQEAVEAFDLAGDPERQRVVAAATDHVGGDPVEHGRGHLGGDGALPDQLVELGLFGFEVAPDLVGGASDRGRPDGLVGLLRTLGLGREPAALVDRIALAVGRADVTVDLLQRLVREVQ